MGKNGFKTDRRPKAYDDMSAAEVHALAEDLEEAVRDNKRLRAIIKAEATVAIEREEERQQLQRRIHFLSWTVWILAIIHLIIGAVVWVM